jgi:hypothetical protein
MATAADGAYRPDGKWWVLEAELRADEMTEGEVMAMGIAEGGVAIGGEMAAGSAVPAAGGRELDDMMRAQGSLADRRRGRWRTRAAAIGRPERE